ncbi:MAG: YkgJ family cysteine cluster protein [Planctomycetes bacterium]|nr:YkgJ family cysteine cluster protein [Planctomycetota bacterium]
MEHKPWYANGLRFECTRCGNCCRNHGEYTFVSLSEVELRQIPAFLGVSRDEFLARYCELEAGFHPTLKMDAPACPFLGADQSCAIYPVRPKQCRTWPFWTENLREATWRGPVKECCPGIDQGKLHSAEEIERTARENDAWYSA